MRRLLLLTFASLLLSAVACNDATSPRSASGLAVSTPRFSIAPGSGTWTTKAPMPTARTGVVTGVIAGQLYVAAGIPSAVEVYDPSLDTWTSRAPIPTNRPYASAGVIDGKLYVVGGCTFSCSPGGTTNVLEVYDPSTNTWTSAAPMPTARAGLATGVIGGKLYAAGGFQYCAGPCPIYNTLEVYDPATNTWTTKAPMPTARAQMGGSVINGELHLVGGTTNGGASGALATLEIYDPSADAWTTNAPMPTPRYALGAGEMNGILYAVSGNVTGEVGVNTVEAYDAATATWTTVAPIPTVRYVPQAESINGVLYVVGAGAGSLPSATLEAFTLTPASTDDCKDSGWMNFTRADGSVFRNQGDCIQFVNTGR